MSKTHRPHLSLHLLPFQFRHSVPRWRNIGDSPWFTSCTRHLVLHLPNSETPLNVWSVMFQIYCRGRTVAIHCERRMWKKIHWRRNMDDDDEVDAHGTRYLQHAWWWQPSLSLAGLTRTRLAALSLSTARCSVRCHKYNDFLAEKLF